MWRTTLPADILESHRHDDETLVRFVNWKVVEEFPTADAQGTPLPPEPVNAPWNSDEFAAPGNTLAAAAREFVTAKEREHRLGNLSARRLNILQLGVKYFIDRAGPNKPLERFGPADWETFHQWVEERIVCGEWKPASASTYFLVAKQLVTWLFETGRIQQPIRNLKTHKITIHPQAVAAYSPALIREVLAASSDRLRLWILLACNTGCTQIDIADLTWQELNLEAGTIVRRRSKTQSHESTPIVSYRLWDETTALLRQFAVPGGERVLLNGAVRRWSISSGAMARPAKRMPLPRRTHALVASCEPPATTCRRCGSRTCGRPWGRSSPGSSVRKPER